MKLIIAIVNNDDAATVLSELTKQGFSATRLQTSGGFLKVGNATFLIGVEDDKVDGAVEIIREYSSQRKMTTMVNPTYINDTMISAPIEVTVGGATVFILDAEQFIKL